MAKDKRDPWVSVRTRHDFAADEVISALQKEIRRSNTENAALINSKTMRVARDISRG